MNKRVKKVAIAPTKREARNRPRVKRTTFVRLLVIVSYKKGKDFQDRAQDRQWTAQNANGQSN